MSSHKRLPPTRQEGADRTPAVRPYRRPELETYGSLKELTRNLNSTTMGDVMMTSFDT